MMGFVRRWLAAFAILSLFTGVSMTVWSVVAEPESQTLTPPATDALNARRAAAMQKAAREGKSTYTFKTDKVPIPVSP